MLATQDKDRQQNSHGLRVILVAPGEATWFGKLYVLSPFSRSTFVYTATPTPLREFKPWKPWGSCSGAAVPCR